MQAKSRNISPIKEKILQYLEYKGISEYKFYRESGVSRGLLRKPSEIGQQTLQKIFAYYKDLSPIWVLENEGTMLRDTENQEIAIASSDDAINIIVLKKLLEECRQENKEKEKTVRKLYEEIGMLRSEISRLSSEKCGIQMAAESDVNTSEYPTLSPQKRYKKGGKKD